MPSKPGLVRHRLLPGRTPGKQPRAHPQSEPVSPRLEHASVAGSQPNGRHRRAIEHELTGLLIE